MADCSKRLTPVSSFSSTSSSSSSSSGASLFKKSFSLLRSLSYNTQRRASSKILGRRLADEPKRPKLILYSTSLRSIRRTFADCSAVRAILRGFHVSVDERDVSMDASFRRELQELLGKGRPVVLPQVYIGSRWLGGVEEIRQMHEAGELVKMLDGVAVQDPAIVCGACGGMRFIPCSNCYGSRKVFVEEEGRMRRLEFYPTWMNLRVPALSGVDGLLIDSAGSCLKSVLVNGDREELVLIMIKLHDMVVLVGSLVWLIDN
ncbi:hypothetical protein ZIOFF_047814 [Zingiber officinale]|uniref:Glutaredoxin domain-containing protein n=1 Tax=Zingiber officinale TaxID=94328 RepID=A0A8J5FY22_ZINOF|nr:hypothetical protein ZIOFF_047814 [Zingiber officinale]